jgi:hypothetical protein
MMGINSRTDKKQITDNLGFNKYAVTGMFPVFPSKIILLENSFVYLAFWFMRQTLFSEKYELKFYIQGDSGGKVNIMGGDSIGQCEKRGSDKIV